MYHPSKPLSLLLLGLCMLKINLFSVSGFCVCCFWGQPLGWCSMPKEFQETIHDSSSSLSLHNEWLRRLQRKTNPNSAAQAATQPLVPPHPSVMSWIFQSYGTNATPGGRLQMDPELLFYGNLFQQSVSYLLLGIITTLKQYDLYIKNMILKAETSGFNCCVLSMAPPTFFLLIHLIRINDHTVVSLMMKFRI